MNIKLTRYALAATFAGGMTLLVACDSGDEIFDEIENIDNVSQALSLSSALGVPVALPSGSPTSTCGLNNGVTPACTSSSASDISYVWSAPSSGTFTFTTNNSNFDTVLVITDYFNPSSVLACKDNNRSAAGESVSLSLSSGQQVLITVDGYAALCGTYKLNITKNCTSSCNSTLPCRAPGYCSISGTCVYENLCFAGEICSGGECVPRCTIDPSYPC